MTVQLVYIKTDSLTMVS